MKTVVITDTNVAKLYPTTLDTIAFPPGELNKTRATKEWIEDQLLERGCNRTTTIIGMGGGVVCDMAGFVAATFCRGVDLVLVPTTLLAMVDAAIGGKNGVNTPAGKNMIGAIYYPKKVLLNLRFLETLPEDEWFNGMVEVLKHGLLADPDLFYQTFDTATTVQRAVEVKRRIIARDLSEENLRKLLNLGHTIGHAIETASGYTVSHGRAVAMGIVIEAQIAVSLGIMRSSVYDVIKSRFPPALLSCDPEEILTAMKNDKKGARRFALLRDIGDPLGVIEVPEETIRQILNDFTVCRR